MKVTSDRLETPTESIWWKDVQRLRLVNDKLGIVLKSGRVVELKHLQPWMIESAFKAYNTYLKVHPISSGRQQDPG